MASPLLCKESSSYDEERQPFHLIGATGDAVGADRRHGIPSCCSGAATYAHLSYTNSTYALAKKKKKKTNKKSE
jgi:hypothetical protein